VSRLRRIRRRVALRLRLGGGGDPQEGLGLGGGARWRRGTGRAGILALSLCALSGGLGAASAGAAVGPGTLRLSEGRGATFPARALVLSVPNRRSLSSKEVHVTENGRPVGAPLVTPIASAGSHDFGVVLAIDTSPTMKGAPLEQAMTAARALAAQRTGKQELGVVLFDRRATVTLPLTDDARAIDAALRRTPPVGSGAYIYNGLTVAVHQLAEAKIAAGAVILLSDGASQGGKPNPGHLVTATAVGQAAAAAHAQIYTVGLRDSSFTPERMSLLARVGGGAFIESTSSQLSSVFTQIESRLTSAYVVHYRSAAPLGHRIDVTVSVDGVPRSARLSYESPAPPRSLAVAPPHRKSFWVSTLALVLLCAIAALFIGLAAVAFLLPRLRGDGVRKRVGAFTMTNAPFELLQAEPTRPQSRSLAPLRRLIERTAWWERFQTSVDVARIGRTPMQMVGWCALATLSLAVLATLVFGTPIAGLLVIPFGRPVLDSIVGRLVQRQRDLFAEQLPTHLQELASTMRAGHALMPAVASMARSAPEPSHTEWTRVVTDEQLGVPLEDALPPLAERMDSEDIGQVALVAALHTRTGGNMAEVLERVADSVRERGELRRELRSLTAQARLSRIVVTALPLMVGLVVTVINPDYEKPLFETTVGIALLIFAIGLVALGSLWMRSITEIEA
jgi:tight adherence protein B